MVARTPDQNHPHGLRHLLNAASRQDLMRSQRGAAPVRCQTLQHADRSFGRQRLFPAVEHSHDRKSARAIRRPAWSGDRPTPPAMLVFVLPFPCRSALICEPLSTPRNGAESRRFFNQPIALTTRIPCGPQNCGTCWFSCRDMGFLTQHIAAKWCEPARTGTVGKACSPTAYSNQLRRARSRFPCRL